MAKAHVKGGIRDAMFARLGIKRRGLILEAPEMATLLAMRDDEGVKKTIVEDGVIAETLRTMVEFTP